MVDIKSILQSATAVESLALLNDNVKFASKKKKTSGGFTKQGLKNIVGSSMLQSQSKLIGDIA